MNEILDGVWKRVVGGLDWLKQVVFGEFEDNRDMSAVVADMLVSFVPGVIIVTSARDLTAVIVRLAQKPERRERVEEWMLVIACAVPLVLPILAAAAGAAAVGVGAIIGGIGGSEAGAALRATCLLLIKQGGHALAELVGFLRRFIKGDILKVLRDIRFMKYREALVRYIGEFIGKLIEVIGRVRAELLKLDAFRWLAGTLRKLEEMERAFYGVQQSAVKAIPRALAELDARLQHVLAESLPRNPRPALAGIPAGNVHPVPTTPGRVPAMPGNPLGRPEGLQMSAPPEMGRPGGANVHPENPRQPSSGQAASKLSREARLEELARDPGQGGKVTPKTRREAEVGLVLEEQGRLPGPITRDPSGSAEFIDATGQKWDVKGFNSLYAPKGYNTEDAVAKIRSEVGNGENVIVDTGKMSASHVADLQQALGAENLSGHVIFF